MIAEHERDCRALREEAERALRSEADASAAHRQAPHEEIEDLKGQLEQYRRTAQAEHETLVAEIAAVTALRNAAIDQAERFREELDGMEEREGDWVGILAEAAERHRVEAEALARELQQARGQAEDATRREGEVDDRLRSVQDELDRLRRDLTGSESPDAVRAALDALRVELDERHRKKKPRAARTDETLDALRIEGDTLLRERDELAAERDLLEEDRARLVESLEVIGERERLEREAIDRERHDSRQREERAIRLAAEQAQQWDRSRALPQQSRDDGLIPWVRSRRHGFLTTEYGSLCPGLVGSWDHGRERRASQRFRVAPGGCCPPFG